MTMMNIFSFIYQSLVIMNGKLTFCIFVICVLEKVFARQKFVEENTNFQYSRCKQISDNVLCESLNISKDSQQKPSLWPPGPFAIPMSNYGCPESGSRGWTQSVLDMAMKQTKRAKQRKKQLKLCVKMRHDSELDTESWIPGSYTVYKIGENCPIGFRDSQKRTSFYEYDSYGIIPNISVYETAQSQRKKLSIASCDKIYTKSDVIESNVTFGMLKTNFKLIKFTVIPMVKSKCSNLTRVGQKGTKCPMSSISSRDQKYCGIVQAADDTVGGAAQLVSGFDVYWKLDSKRNDVRLKNIFWEWYQIDLRRSMHVSRIEMVFSQKNEHTFQQCWHSEMNLGFLYGEALKCIYTYKNGHLFLRHVRARYIALDFQVYTLSSSASKSQLKNQASFKIYTTDSESMDGELCNEDLGMSDGSIQNNQISASSWSELHQPFNSRPSSTGWCNDKVKDTNPWIMVDLISITKIEGVTIYASKGAHIHSSGSWNSFHLLYGNQTNNLTIYGEKLKTDFDQSTSRKHRSFLLQNSVAARLIKLELNESDEAEEICLRFEIHGCKLSGIPISSECVHKIKSNVYVAEQDNSHDHIDESSGEEADNSTSSSDYKSYNYFNDMEHEDYSYYDNNNLSLIESNKESTQTESDVLTAEFCMIDAVELFPTFIDGNATIITNALYLQKASVIMSIGYPFLTGSGYCYSWLIDFNHQHYVRLIFTNITLNQMAVDDHDGCEDKLILGTDLQEEIKGTEIDNKFNESLFIIETNNTFVVITFQLCFHKFKGSRFRAVVSKEDIPACLSIRPSVNWSNGRKEICTNPEMILTSMSILNIPFDNFEERFKIRANNHHGIEIEFIDFYIVCPIEITESRSRLTIIERNGNKKNTYCNTNKPPEKISSEERTLLIVFRKYEDPTKDFTGKEGFRLHYRTKNYSLANWTEIAEIDGDIKGSNITTVCSPKFKKCYNIFSSSMSWYEAGTVCGEYDQFLVTIQSPKELQYINYLLREQRYIDGRAEISDSKGSSYKAHIGLKRKMVTDRKEKYVWSNNYEVIFSPWAVGEPSVGDCTCTNFRSFITDRTWESEDCNNEHTAYFICQSDYNEKAKAKFASKKSRCNTLTEGNKTKIDYSYSGKLCQNWNNLTKNALIHFFKTFGSRRDVLKTNSTLCQDISHSGIMGCYVNDSESTWEPCFFSQTGSDSMIMDSSDVFFECNSTGRLIPLVNKCDQKFHCEDKTDEVNCTTEEHDLTRNVDLSSTILNVTAAEEENYHLCGSKEWISIAAKCDTVIDCLDASDEIDCIRQSTDCNENEFACADGSCIKLGQVCDFKPDCANEEDEFCELRNCRLNEYACDNKQCINDRKCCDSIPHCIDGSDEIGCLECRESFHCDGDRCIDNKLVCDKVRDCEDGSDESGCTTDDALSCEKWWHKGYFESGQRVIDGMKVYCDYGSRGGLPRKISTEIKNLDLDAKSKTLYTESLYSKSKYLAFARNSQFYNLVTRMNTCTVDVKSTCQLPENSASMFDENYQQFTNELCQCSIETFNLGTDVYDDYNYYEKSVDDGYEYEYEDSFQILIRRKRSMFEDPDNNFIRDLGYQSEDSQLKACKEGGIVRSGRTYYTFDKMIQQIDVKSDVIEKKVPVDIRINKISCTQNSTDVYDNNMYVCYGDNATIPKSEVCNYDVDAAGYMTGCRSGIHLQDCKDFVCPQNTVKCPDSFCIALRFVCDGIAQCPGGQDEHNCSCVSGDKEVTILIEDTKQQTHSKKAATFLAKQFKHGNNKVRLLFYQAETRLDGFPLLHRLLEIREENIDSFDELSYDCTYKTMARNFLPSLQFKNDEANFLIFIEDSVESSTVARIMFSNISKPEFTIYRVIRNFSFLTNINHTYEFVKDVRINKWSSLHSIGYRHFPEICKEVSHVPCAGGFRCYSSKQCIPLHQVCDGIVHCMNNDDEHMCGFRCHYKCKCVDGVVDCRKAKMNISDIRDLSRNTRSADLSYNHGIKDILSKENINFPFMMFLDVSNCRIEVVSSKAFSDINNLLKLNISHNVIKKLSDNVFRDLRHLVELDLDGSSELEEISALAFQGLQSIKTIRISGTKLKKIATLTFSNLKLESIDISNNEIREIENFAFNNTSVKKINFEGNNILEFHQLIFSDVAALIELRTPAYKFCCIRPCYVKESNCYPSKNEFSSCDDLMRHPILQAVLWLVGIASLFGNLASIVYRVVYDRQRLKIGYGIFVTHLASADFLMGIYLIVIAFIDSIYRGRYIYMDDQWRNSIWCTVTGFLSTVSSEASVFFLCLITIDRLLVIKYPFGHVRFTPKRANICCFICWVIAISLAAIPIFHTSYFKNKFYSRSGVCIALPLSRDKPPGWMYSVSIFVGLNFGTFILVAFGQLSIFLELRKSSMGGKKTQKSRKRDLQVAKNLILVATTDFLCWFPIGLMGILSLNGYPISGDVYAFTAVFILPFNSALNPFLYTLSAIIGKKSFNPSLDEQSRTEMQKEIGSAILQYTDFSRSVRTKREIVPGGKTRRIKDVIDDEENMSVASVTAISYQLANYLRLLHESSVGIEKLSETNTFVRYGKKNAKKPIIVLDTKMTLVTDDRKKADNIYQYGCLLRKMIARCKANDR